jgi:hypothetical protein
MNSFACDPDRTAAAAVPRPPGRRQSATRRAILAAPALFVALAAGPRLPADAPLDLPVTGESPEKVRCPDCEGSRRIPCETCDGAGEIRRPCPLCKGSGKKPCPVCGDEQGGRGRLECSLCRGQGIRGPSGKVCSRCQGTKTIACLTCKTKGVLPCRKYVVDKVCPDCRFVGKLPCPTCVGSGETDAARAPRPSKAEGARNGAAPAAARPLDSRYQTAASAHEAHADVFSDDPTPRISTLRAEASRLAKSLNASGNPESEDTLHQIGRFLSRADNFRRRFIELREAYVAAVRSKKKLDGLHEARKKAAAGDHHPASREEAERKWTNRIDIALKIFERETADLSAEEPQWLLKEVEDLEALWKDLGKKGAAVAAAPVRPAPASAPRAKSGATVAVASVAESERASESESDSDSASVPESVAESDSDSASASVADSAAPAAGRQRPVRPASPPEPSEDPWTPWVPAAWAAVGFLAGTLVFLARSRRNGKPAARKPERERAVSSSRRSSSL